MLPIGAFDTYDLGAFIIVGDAGRDRQSYFSMFDDKEEARRAAMAWLVCGWSTKVIALNLEGVPDDTPSIPYRYNNLDSVKDAGVTKYSLQERPRFPPREGMSLDEFYAWLRDLSLSTPTRSALDLDWYKTPQPTEGIT